MRHRQHGELDRVEIVPRTAASLSRHRAERAGVRRGCDRSDDSQQPFVKQCACNCVHVPAVLLAAVVEESFLLVAARGVGVAFGTGGRFSAVPFSGV